MSRPGRRTWNLALASSALVGVIAWASPSIAACPAGSYQLAQELGPFPYPLAVLDTTHSEGPFASRVAYDLTQASATITLTQAREQLVAVFPADAYRIHGPLPGAQVDLVLSLDYEGWIDVAPCREPCRATFQASLFEEFFIVTHLVRSEAAGGRTSEHRTLEKPFTVQAGVPFTVGFRLGVQTDALGDYAASWTATLRFEGLPDGAWIESCQGYDTRMTSVRATTWGRVKALYR